MTYAGGFAERAPHLQEFLTGGGIGVEDWPTIVPGAVGVLGIVVAVMVAWRQRVIQLRDRAAEREQQEARRAERQAHEARIARREMWRAEYQQIRALLENGEVLAYQVRNNGPFTARGLAALDVATFRMNAERLAARGVEQLRAPLLGLATLADEFARCAVPEEEALVAGYARGQVPDEWGLHRVQRLAVGQDRTARDLADQVAAAWQVLRAEWGN